MRVGLLVVMALALSGCLGTSGSEYRLLLGVEGKGMVEEVRRFVEANETVVELKAHAEPHWVFSHWIGEVGDAAQDTTLVKLDKNKQVKAVFVEIMGDGGETPVEFADANLEQAVREAVGKPAEVPLTQGDVAKLKALDAKGRKIQDLTGINQLRQLERLDLSNNAIENLEPLSRLWNLMSLDLSGNRITDLSPLENQGALTQLNLNRNQISDLSPLAGLNGLVSLEVADNQISDLAPLGKLYGLQSLDLAENDISDLLPLAGLPNLNYLNLEGNNISDLSPISNLPELWHLYLGRNQITDISDLAHLVALRFLDLQHNEITNIDPIKRMVHLVRLNLEGNRITDLTPLLENEGLSQPQLVSGTVKVNLKWNNLDVSPQSPAWQAIQTLLRCGIDVQYLPQNK